MRTKAVSALRRCALALLPLLTACGETVDPHAVPVVQKAAPKPTVDAETDEALAASYLTIKERFAALTPEDSAGPGRILAEDGPKLRTIADKAKDLHLRANASLLLGTLHEAGGDARSAISFYRQVIALLPGEVEPHRVLAVALAADKQFAAAMPEQQIVVKDDPDDLEAWLLLGELAVKAEQKEIAAEAYAGYEMRRKGLTDGISLKKTDGTFTLPAEQRAACARALIPARDNGTALALLYALSIETEPSVRVALVEAMGTQRLTGYKQALEAALKTEKAQEVKEALIWALAEIQRDPLDTRPGPVPEAGAGAAGAGAGETKPGETTPADGKSAGETKPGETTPADGKPAGETKPGETTPADGKPAETTPADVKPADVKTKADRRETGAPPTQ